MRATSIISAFHFAPVEVELRNMLQRLPCPIARRPVPSLRSGTESDTHHRQSMLLQHLLLYIPFMRNERRQQSPLLWYDQLFACWRAQIPAVELYDRALGFFFDVDGFPEPAEGGFGS